MTVGGANEKEVVRQDQILDILLRLRSQDFDLGLDVRCERKRDISEYMFKR